MNYNNGNVGSAISGNLKNSVYSNPGQVAVSPMVTNNNSNNSNNSSNNNSNNSGVELLNSLRGNNGNKDPGNNGFNMGSFNQQNKGGFNSFIGNGGVRGGNSTNNINPVAPSTSGAGGVALSALQQQQFIQQQRQQQQQQQQQQEQGNGENYNANNGTSTTAAAAAATTTTETTATATTTSMNSSSNNNIRKIPIKSKATVFQYKGKHLEIRDVYNDTLIQEIGYIRKLISKYKYIAMDTEFPGVVARPIADSVTTDQQYQTLRCNVDLLKIIQLGVAFFDENGELAPDCPCWQFNFRFSLDDDMFAQDSIELLQHSGIDFKQHNARGIDVHDFGELLISSGLVLMPGVTWITFHGGYDFGYLLKVLTCKPLPETEDGFFALMRTYFPSIYDEKYMAKMGNGFEGGLNRLGEDLQVERIGQMHQAGSDSLLTGQVFFKLRDVIFGGTLRKDYESILYGLGVDRAPRFD